jgi:hypothetical protein
MIISERIDNLSYRVDIDEQTMQATRCNCISIQRCKHMRIATEVLAPAEPKINAIEAGVWFMVNGDSQVWWNEEMQRWFAIGPTENARAIVLDYRAKQQAVATAEQITATPVVAEMVDEMPTQQTETRQVAKHFRASQLAQIAQMLDEKPAIAKSADLSTCGNLNTGQKFSLLMR